jgi:hypothetical protein
MEMCLHLAKKVGKYEDKVYQYFNGILDFMKQHFTNVYCTLDRSFRNLAVEAGYIQDVPFYYKNTLALIIKDYHFLQDCVNNGLDELIKFSKDMEVLRGIRRNSIMELLKDKLPSDIHITLQMYNDEVAVAKDNDFDVQTYIKNLQIYNLR